jgi:hypothetical protein
MNEILCKTNGVYEIWESEYDKASESYYPIRKLRDATPEEIPSDKLTDTQKLQLEIINLKKRLDKIDG